MEFCSKKYYHLFSINQLRVKKRAIFYISNQVMNFQSAIYHELPKLTATLSGLPANEMGCT